MAAASTAGCASAGAESTATVTVSFGSEAMGIDRAAFETVQTLAASSPLVKSHSVTAWGREGEQTVTLTAADDASAKALLAEVRSALPAKVRKGYIDIAGPGGVKLHIGTK